uniref:Uncharacterized protein n=1 Tax=Anguilla anguilla TaxID=7936 RepID=A0A0E9W4F6_ANGAN
MQPTALRGRGSG